MLCRSGPDGPQAHEPLNWPMADKLLCRAAERAGPMDAFLIAAAVVFSFLGAFAIQKAALKGLLRLMDDVLRRQAGGHPADRHT